MLRIFLRKWIYDLLTHRIDLCLPNSTPQHHPNHLSPNNFLPHDKTALMIPQLFLPHSYSMKIVPPPSYPSPFPTIVNPTQAIVVFVVGRLRQAPRKTVQQQPDLRNSFFVLLLFEDKWVKCEYCQVRDFRLQG